VHLPWFGHEYELKERGYRLVAGIDEVGRGAIAGPVGAAAVVLPCDRDLPWAKMVRDSKQLSPSRREYLAQLIRANAISIGFGMVPSEEVDALGIVKATRLAMGKAVKMLSCKPDFLLIDALKLPDVPLPQRSIIHGDRISVSIACASIVAKVARDQLMVEMDSLHPGYNLARHKGYGTKDHLESLSQLGPCPLHRRSFAPLRMLPGL
jgi:ribonuclease HII